MIQKVAMTGVQTAKTVAMHSRQSIVLNNTLNKEFNSVNKSFKFAQSKRFFIELKTELKSFFNKISQKDELPKINKASKSDIMYNEKMQKELEEQAKQRNVVKWRKEDNEKLIKQSGHSVSSGDIDQNGYLTSSGKKKVENPSFKGHQDDLDFEDTISKQLSHEQDTQLHELDIADPYNETIMGRHSAKTIEPGQSSLSEAMSHNHEQSHNLEHGHDLSETISSHHDDLTDELFG